jgi:hypothetical protein
MRSLFLALALCASLPAEARAQDVVRGKPGDTITAQDKDKTRKDEVKIIDEGDRVYFIKSLSYSDPFLQSLIESQLALNKETAKELAQHQEKLDAAGEAAKLIPRAIALGKQIVARRSQDYLDRALQAAYIMNYAKYYADTVFLAWGVKYPLKEYADGIWNSSRPSADYDVVKLNSYQSRIKSLADQAGFKSGSERSLVATTPRPRRASTK